MAGELKNDDNDALINLDGLSGLTIVGQVRMRNNDSLYQSFVDAFVAGITVTGTSDPGYDNDKGC